MPNTHPPIPLAKTSLHWIDMATIIAYFVVMLLIGVWASYRIKTRRDFFAAGRGLSSFIMIMLGFGSSTNADQQVAVISQSFRTGLSGIWFQWVYLFGQCSGYLIAPLCRRARTLTQPEFFTLRYSQGYGTFYAFLGLFVLMVNIGNVLLGSGVIVKSVMNLEMPMWIILSVTSAIFIFYSLLGGLIAAALTDAIQGAMTIILSFILIPYLLHKVGGMHGLHQGADPHMFSLTAPSEMTLFVITIFSINAVFGTPGAPHVLPSYAAGKDEAGARHSAITGTMIKRLCTVAWAFIGIMCYALYKDTVPADQADEVFGIAVKDLLPRGLTGLMVSCIFAALMANTSALMIFASGIFTVDIYPKLVKRAQTEKELVLVGRLASLAVVIGGLIVAELIPNLREGLIYFWQVCLFASFAFWAALIWRRANTAGAWASTLGTFVVWLILEFTMKPKGNYELRALEMLYCMIAGFVFLVAGSLLTPAPQNRQLNEFYRRLRTPVGADATLDKL